MMKVTVADARKLSYCLLGVRRVCHRYGLDFKAFIREGIDAEVLERIDDAQIQRLIEAAHGR